MTRKFRHLKWTIKSGNILDESADVLVVSANVGLNLSDGVSGDLLARCGPDMQRVLHDYLYDHQLQFVQQVVRVALQMAATKYQAKKKFLTTLATGYGNLTLADFGGTLRPLASENFAPVEEVCICLKGEDRMHELAQAFPEATVVG